MYIPALALPVAASAPVLEETDRSSDQDELVGALFCPCIERFFSPMVNNVSARREVVVALEQAFAGLLQV